MSQWVWLGLYIPTQTLAIGPFVMTSYSFMADNSSPRFIAITLLVLILKLLILQRQTD